MNIAVCVKQVPDTTAKKELSGTEYRLNRDRLESVINPFDEYAIEEAIRQKESHDPSEVTLVTMGPASAEETMRKGLAMGADRGILITDEGLAGSDVWVTARVLAAALSKESFDLVLCGQESADSRTGLLPGALAEHLDMPLLSFVEKLEIDGQQATAQQELTGGHRSMSAGLPAVVMVVKAINEPRYPSLKGIMASKRKEIAKLSLGDLGLDPSTAGMNARKSTVVSVTPRPQKQPGQVVKDQPPAEAAKLIADFLFENKVLA